MPQEARRRSWAAGRRAGGAWEATALCRRLLSWGCGLWLVLGGMLGSPVREVGARQKTQPPSQVTIGGVEDVILLPWGVKLPARIDTGARTSSMDARNLKAEDGIVEFDLPPAYGGLHLRLPVAQWRTIKDRGEPQRRPVVELELCLGPKRLRILVNLVDRSHLRFPMLVGRRVLEHDFLVDVRSERLLPPTCPGQTP
ncbi:MAG: ATP-dependent zinc protease [Candidatus Tectomicrobia bacterium]|nr:ATP-dependent zinc protease [Candidatus Tectomicrobia bacterium]